MQAQFDGGSEQRPVDFDSYVHGMQGNGGQFWQFAEMLYESAVNLTPDESTVLNFVDVCPPFRAFLYALALTWYDRCIRPSSEEEFNAGRNDQMMAVYLPYCDQFITAEKKGMQERCLRESARAADIPVSIRSYDDFYEGFCIAL